MPGHTLDNGRYEIRELVGRGGMGDVYRAWDTRLRRDVAIKRLHPELVADDDVLARFEREAHALARVNHPGVIQVYDLLADGDDGARYLVLQYIPGESLDARVRRAGRLDWATCATIGREVSGALGAAHAAGLIHRDVKPSNILLDVDGRTHLADFGVARLGDGSKSRTNLVIGTPGYIAPEVATGDPVTPSVDLYGLAATLYEAYCGAPPYDAGDGPASAALIRHVTAPIPDPAVLRPDASGSVRALLMKGLAKSPRERFVSAAEMAAALEASQAQDGDTRVLPVAAVPPPPPPSQTPTSVLPRQDSDAAPPTAGTLAPQRRRRTPLVLAALVLVAALAVGGYALTQRGDDRQASRTSATESTPAPVIAAETAPEETTPAETTPATPAPTATVTVTTERVTTAPALAPVETTADAPPPAPEDPAPTMDEARALVDHAWQAFTQGDSETTLDESQRALRTLDGTGDPYEANANYNVGMALMEMGDCPAALSYFEAAAAHPTGTKQQQKKRAQAVRKAEKCA